MKRSIAKAVADHHSYMEKHNGSGDIYPSDIAQLLELSTRADGSIDFYNAIGDAFYAGFSVGYRTAKRGK